MRKVIIAFSGQLADAASLALQTEKLCPSGELWVLGGLKDFPAEQTGALRIVEVLARHEEILNEPCACAAAIYELFAGDIPEIIICPSGLLGDELAAQLSLAASCACVLGARALSPSNDGILVRKSVYAGNLVGEFLCRKLPLAVSLLPNGSKCPPSTPTVERQISDTQLPPWLSSTQYVEVKREFSLSDADVVVAAGRGVGKNANFEKLKELAQVLGGVLGGTRPTVCDGKLPSDRLIGMSGSLISPELCIAFGASGAAAFMAGVERSRRLVAVNRDPNALIFENCDLGVVANCGEFADALIALLRGD